MKHLILNRLSSVTHSLAHIHESFILHEHVTHQTSHRRQHTLALESSHHPLLHRGSFIRREMLNATYWVHIVSKRKRPGLEKRLGRSDELAMQRHGQSTYITHTHTRARAAYFTSHPHRLPECPTCTRTMIITTRIVAGSTTAGPIVPSVEVATIAAAAGMAVIVINAPTCNVRVGNTELEVALARTTVTHAGRVPI